MTKECCEREWWIRDPGSSRYRIKRIGVKSGCVQRKHRQMEILIELRWYRVYYALCR